jgi:YVTN family beta-propeller protein
MRRNFALIVFLSLLAAVPGSLSASAQAVAYVSNQNSNNVSVINTVTNTVTATVTVGNNPQGLAASPDGSLVYVTNANDNTVSVIGTATNTVIATVPVGNTPEAVAVSPNGGFAYVANYGDNTVSVISTTTNAIVTTVTLPASDIHPYGIVFAPGGRFAYVVETESVSVIATASNTVATTIPAVPQAGNDGPGVAISPNGLNLYVSQGLGNMAVISTATNQQVATISTTGGVNGSALADLAVLPNGALGYGAVAGFSEVVIFDTNLNTVVTTIPVGAYPFGLAITPDGSLCYVANENDNTVSAITTGANPAVVATLSVGIKPYAIAISVQDNDSQYSQLNGGNTLIGNQTVNGNVTATNFVGSGAGLTGVNAANSLALGGVPASTYARLDSGNTFNGNQTVNGSLAATVNVSANNSVTAPVVYAGNVSASNTVFAIEVHAGDTVSAANNVTAGGNVSATNLVSATNVVASGNVSTGTLSSAGTVTIGGGTPIKQYLSMSITPSPDFPLTIAAGACPVRTVNFPGAGDGDTVTLGVPISRIGTGSVIYFAWVSAANTVTIRACNLNQINGHKSTGLDPIHVDIWKHQN